MIILYDSSTCYVMPPFLATLWHEIAVHGDCAIFSRGVLLLTGTSWETVDENHGCWLAKWHDIGRATTLGTDSLCILRGGECSAVFRQSCDIRFTLIVLC